MRAPRHDGRLGSPFVQAVPRWLAGVTAAVLTIAVIATAGAFHSGAPSSQTPAGAIPRIAVLPVDTPPGALNADLAAAAPILTDAIIASLSQFAGPRADVLTRWETAELSGERRTLDGVRALNAEYLLDVSLRPSAGPLRVRATLAHVGGAVLWTTELRLPPDDLATLDVSVAPGIAQRVAQAIVPAAVRMARR